MHELTEKEVAKYQKQLEDVKREVSKVVIGQRKPIDGILRGLLANGHILVEGVPGIAKTLIIRALGQTTGCLVKRIQFTADLLPSDIAGITAYNEKKKEFYTVKGPVFANFLIADEINRSPAKTQSALLEAMQERQVTIGKETFTLQEPFFVLATQNPIESEGVYSLPEAQVDRFLFKLNITYPTIEEEKSIINTNISLNKFEDYELKQILKPSDIINLQQIAKKVFFSDKVYNYVVHLVDATRNPKKYNIELGKYIEYGASPRASIGLFIGAKTGALIAGDNYVTPQHIKDVAHDVLRHRLILNYEGQAENISTEHIISEVLAKVPVP